MHVITNLALFVYIHVHVHYETNLPNLKMQRISIFTTEKSFTDEIVILMYFPNFGHRLSILMVFKASYLLFKNFA